MVPAKTGKSEQGGARGLVLGRGARGGADPGARDPAAVPLSGAVSSGSLPVSSVFVSVACVPLHSSYLRETARKPYLRLTDVHLSPITLAGPGSGAAWLSECLAE